jgi:hypothetical protein
VLNDSKYKRYLKFSEKWSFKILTYDKFLSKSRSELKDLYNNALIKTFDEVLAYTSD